MYNIIRAVKRNLYRNLLFLFYMSIIWGVISAITLQIGGSLSIEYFFCLTFFITNMTYIGVEYYSDMEIVSISRKAIWIKSEISLFVSAIVFTLLMLLANYLLDKIFVMNSLFETLYLSGTVIDNFILTLFLFVFLGTAGKFIGFIISQLNTKIAIYIGVSAYILLIIIPRSGTWDNIKEIHVANPNPYIAVVLLITVTIIIKAVNYILIIGRDIKTVK